MHPEIELSYPQILMLYVLLENGTSSMSEVASLLKISHGVATRTADRLVDKRLVDRRHADTDRRMVLLSLSKQGKEYAEEMLGNHMEKLNGVFEEVNLQEREGFLTLLENIDARLEE
jgi:DNA-binding MarR family transcriptional regulator